MALAAVVSAAPPVPPGDKPAPTVFSRLKECGDAEKFPGTAYITVVDSTVNTVGELGVSRMETYRLLKILNEEGCRSQSVQRWHYEPLSSYVIVEKVAVVRGDSLIPVDIAGVRDLPAPQEMIYWQDRIKVLQLPRLEIGDGIQITAVRKGYSYALLDSPQSEPPDEKFIPPMPGEYFDVVLFQSHVPTVYKTYTLRLPRHKQIHSQEYNGSIYSAISYDSAQTTYSWWQDDVPARKQERASPEDPDVVPKVVIATVESWEAKSRWFFDVNRNQFDVTEPIQAKVDEILRDAGVFDGTPEQKAFELVHWVAQNIRYSGQTMGEGEGFTLHPGEMIFEQRSGVCKDIAGMLVTMMRAADLDSYAAMTMAGSRVENVPADQFNHCVVALRKADGSFEMYDPTWVPNNRDIWSKYETEQQFVVGTPDGEGLSEIPYSPPQESPLKVTNQVRLDASGRLVGSIRIEGDGVMDGRLRNYAAGGRRARVRDMWAAILRQIDNGIVIDNVSRGDELDFHAPMWWQIDYSVPRYGLVKDSVIELHSPLLKLLTTGRELYNVLALVWSEKRESDLMLWSASRLDASETIQLPAGFALEETKSPDSVSETYAAFAGSVSSEHGKVNLTLHFDLHRRQFPKEGYEGFRKAVEAAREYAELTLRCTKGRTRHE